MTPHMLRHTAAMSLLRCGMGTQSSPSGLDHEEAKASQIYFHVEMTIKEQALASAHPRGTSSARYRPPETLLAFLETL